MGLSHRRTFPEGQDGVRMNVDDFAYTSQFALNIRWSFVFFVSEQVLATVSFCGLLDGLFERG
jgi:tryptophan-rich sensory protein